MPCYDNIGGAGRRVSKIYNNIGGVARTVQKGYDNIGGVGRQYFSGAWEPYLLLNPNISGGYQVLNVAIDHTMDPYPYFFISATSISNAVSGGGKEPLEQRYGLFLVDSVPIGTNISVVIDSGGTPNQANSQARLSLSSSGAVVSMNWTATNHIMNYTTKYAGSVHVLAHIQFTTPVPIGSYVERWVRVKSITLNGVEQL